ncbi:hypothetical protein WV34_06495 [Bacillus amyloliquefaciens]|nr:hypothetical protein WV34_06495 [Bacillus amyloliquefaciens]
MFYEERGTVIKSIILSAVLIIGAVAVTLSVSAVWWGHQTSKKVRVYTDATTYTSRTARPVQRNIY